MAAVQACGIDIRPWGLRQDGTAVAEPEKNPQYCYDWSFGNGRTEPIALCVWHESLQIRGDQIVYTSNVRAQAISLARRTEQPFAPRAVVSRARSQAKRAQEFDSAIQRAAHTSMPIRLIVLAGDRRDSAEPGLDSSSIQYRRVDDETWYLDEYDWNSGAFVLVRGSRLEEAATPEVSGGIGFVDQFSTLQPPQRRETQVSAYVRSPKVRTAALVRSGGRCELCGEPGFATPSGDVYLETHHVVALALGGPDVPWNVVALCPNDHRKAHFSTERIGLQRSLIQKLVVSYPESAPHWEPLLQAQSLSG